MQRKFNKKSNITEIKLLKKKSNKKYSPNSVTSYNVVDKKERKRNIKMEIIDLNSTNTKEISYHKKKKKMRKSVNKTSKKKPIKKQEKSILINLSESECDEKMNDIEEEKIPKKKEQKIQENENKDDYILSLYEVLDSSKNNDNLLSMNDSLYSQNIKIVDVFKGENEKFQSKKIKEKNDSISKVPNLLSKKRRKKGNNEKEEMDDDNYIIKINDSFSCKNKDNITLTSKKNTKINNQQTFNFTLNDSKSNIKKIKQMEKKPEEKNVKLNSELSMFYYLIQEYDIENMVDSIYNSKNFQKYDIQSFLNNIKVSYGVNELITILLKCVITLMKETEQDIPNRINPLEDKNISLNYKISSKQMKKCNSSIKNVQGKAENLCLDKPNDKLVQKKKRKINSANKNNNVNNNNTDYDDINLRNDRVWSFESHYNKDKDGNIYKYEVGFLYQKSIIFRCFDHRCTAKGTFDLETKKFKVRIGHNLKHSEHDYIINSKNNNDSIWKEMIKNNYLDSQVYKEGKSTIVRFYS